MAKVYCIDTSSLIAAWQERYPIENFPSFWLKVEALINQKRLVSPIEVLNEMKKKSDDLHAWLKARSGMFRDLEDKIQIEAANILAQFPRLVGQKKIRTSADTFVIALAKVESLQIVTDEKPTGSLDRPNIPDVCSALGLDSHWHARSHQNRKMDCRLVHDNVLYHAYQHEKWEMF